MSRKIHVVYTIPMFSQECTGTYARFHDVIHTLQRMKDPPWDYTIVPLRRYYGDPSPNVLFQDGSAFFRLKNYLRNVVKASRNADIVHIVQGDVPYSLLVSLVVSSKIPLVAGPNVAVGTDYDMILRNRGGFRTWCEKMTFYLGLSTHNQNKLVFHRRSPISTRYKRIFAFKGYRLQGIRLGGLAEHKIVTISSGVRSDVFSPFGPALVGKRAFTILYVGDSRRAYLKGYDIFLGGLEALKSRRVDFEAWIVGRNSRYEHQLVQKYGLGDRVELKGFVSRKNMAAVYRGADVYVNSSRYESDNTAAIESLACGTPVVGTDILGINKSLAFRWGDSIDLSRRLIHVFEHKDELKSETLDSAADWDIRLVMDDFHKVYRDVLKGA